MALQHTWTGIQKIKNGYVLLDNESPVTEVIDVMAVGGTGHLKVSLPYFLVNGIPGEVQAQLLLSCMCGDRNCLIIILVEESMRYKLL